MSNISSSYEITYVFGGAISLANVWIGANNVASPAWTEYVTILKDTIGLTVVTPQNKTGGNNPAVPTLYASSVLILPEANNPYQVFLRHDLSSGSEGIPLHKTSPSLIALDPSCGSIAFHTRAGTGFDVRLRLIWL